MPLADRDSVDDAERLSGEEKKTALKYLSEHHAKLRECHGKAEVSGGERPNNADHHFHVPMNNTNVRPNVGTNVGRN